MENTNKKKKNVLAIILGVILVAVTTFGVLLYTGVVKSPMVKEKDCKETKCDTTTKNDTKKTDTKTDTTKSADERYKEYISNLAESIKKNYVSDHEIVKTDHESYTKDKYNKQSFTGGANNHGYSIAVKNNLELVYNYMTTDDEIIAKDVVSFFVIHEGNGIYKTLYYITTDGKLHSANLELYFFEGEELKRTDLDYKNIVEVKQGSSTAAMPIFIDIDGNVIFKNN